MKGTLAMTHEIEVYAGAEPLKLLRRRVPLHHKQILLDKLDVCSEKGLTALSHSPYSAPAIMVPKRMGKYVSSKIVALS